MSRMRTLRKNLDADAVKRAKDHQRKVDRQKLGDYDHQAIKRAAERLRLPVHEMYQLIRREAVTDAMLIQ